MADVVIVGLTLVAIYWGLRRGLLRPLVTEGLFLFALLFTTQYHDALAGIFGKNLPPWAITGPAVLVITLVLTLLSRPLIGIVRSFPGVRPVDNALGAIVNGVIALLLIYEAVGVVLDFDQHVYPILVVGSATVHEVQDYRNAIESNPLLKSLVNTDQLNQFSNAGNGAIIPKEELEKVDAFLKFYELNVRTPLLSSHLAALINEWGGKVPVIGKRRPYLSGNTVGAS